MAISYEKMTKILEENRNDLDEKDYSEIWYIHSY